MKPQIIRTVAELEALEPSTVLVDKWGDLIRAHSALGEADREPESFSPLAVIATGDQVRAAREALENAK